MISKKKVLIVFGTRPEAIKMVSIVKEFEKENDRFETVVCVTAQHRQMLDQVLALFEIKPHHDLNLMTKNQTLSELTSKVLLGVTKILINEKPDMIFVQGDTTTTFISALVAFYHKIPIAHIEAGLRTHNRYNPFPEEMNRKLTSSLAHLHFAPTYESKQNLLNEGISKDVVHITGNTVIDALKLVIHKHKNEDINAKWSDYFQTNFGISFNDLKQTILVTGHRRESFGEGFKNICKAISILAHKNPNINVIYPVHLNPNVQKPVYSILGNINNVFLIPPLTYESFIYLMNKSYIILTDSGGIQEEAPTLGKPVLVLRETTERPEGVEACTSKLVGTKIYNIVKETELLLNDRKKYNKISRIINPYGDGFASKKIINIIKEYFIMEK